MTWLACLHQGRKNCNFRCFIWNCVICSLVVFFPAEKLLMFSDCNRQCWCYWSEGMNCVGQREIALILERQGLGDRQISAHAFTFYKHIFDRARKGKIFNTADFMSKNVMGWVLSAKIVISCHGWKRVKFFGCVLQMHCCNSNYDSWYVFLWLMAVTSAYRVSLMP